MDFHLIFYFKAVLPLSVFISISTIFISISLTSDLGESSLPLGEIKQKEIC